MPAMATRMTMGKKNKRGFGMGMSAEFAETVFLWANWFLLGALVVGLIATYTIVVSGNIKEAYLKRGIAEAGQQAAEADARAAEANRKAEEERLERLKLEAKIAPRRLNADQQRAITTALKSFSGRKVMIKSYALDVEAAILGKQIIKALTSTNIDVSDNILSVSSLGSIALAVHVTGNDEPLVAKLLDVLSSIGNLLVTPDPVPAATGMSTGGGNESAMAAVIFVGPKPIQ